MHIPTKTCSDAISHDDSSSDTEDFDQFQIQDFGAFQVIVLSEPAAVMGENQTDASGFGDHEPILDVSDPMFNLEDMIRKVEELP